MTTAPMRFQNIEEEDEEKPTYTQPIKLENLPYTPTELGGMLEEHATTKRSVIKEVNIDGLGGGRLAITKSNNPSEGYQTLFYADEKNQAFNQQQVNKAETLFTFANAPAILAPILAPFSVKSQPVTRIKADGGKHKITKGGQTIFQQRKSNKNTLKRLKNEERIEDVTGFGDKSILADTDVFNMPNVKIRDIIRIAKKNKISYEKAEAYVNLKEQGIVPQQTINPGTNKGLLKKGEGRNDPTVYIPPNERIGTQKGDPLEIRFNANEEAEPGDVPTFDLSTMIDPIRGKNRADKNILSILNANGMRGGRVDIFKYRDAGKNREAVEYYMSPYSKMVKFNLRKNNIALAMHERFGGKEQALGIAPKGSFQAHHITPIKAAFTGFHGIVKESPKYNYYMKLFNDKLLYTGNQIENIVQAIGHVDRERDSPHSRVHKLLDMLMGKAGELFWTDEVLESLVVRDKEGNIIRTRNDEMRERLMIEQIKLFKRAEDVLNIAMQEYELYASNTIVPPEQIVEFFTGKLPPDLKAEPDLIKKLTRDAIEDFASTHVPSIVGGTLDLKTLQRAQELADRPLNWWKTLNVQEKIRRLPEYTESYYGAGDGFTFEQLNDLVYHGYIDAETVDKLVNAPVKFESIEDIIDDVLSDSDDLLDKLRKENPLL